MAGSFADYLMDELAALGNASLRVMFGGHGLYLGGVMIGILFDDVLYLKVGPRNRADFEAAGSEPFTYERQGRRVALSFWRTPDEVIEDGEALRAWILKARDAAFASARERSKPKRPAVPQRKKARRRGRTKRPRR
ncbi:MAG: TfoX/Sxy family protein [Pseudomonadota bacterium]